MSTPTSTRSSRSAARARSPLRPWSAEHFYRWAERLVFDDSEQHPPEDWQMAFVEDLFAGRPENWLLTPEGNGKTTFTAELALYGADFADGPWIPVAAASAKQARILHDQAGEFVRRTPELGPRFRVFDGSLKIASRKNGGRGIEIFAADPKTGDGVIPFPFAIVDEGHRQEDMRLYRLWKGKLRKRGAQIIMLSTAGERECTDELGAEGLLEAHPSIVPGRAVTTSAARAGWVYLLDLRRPLLLCSVSSLQLPTASRSSPGIADPPSNP